MTPDEQQQLGAYAGQTVDTSRGSPGPNSSGYDRHGQLWVQIPIATALGPVAGRAARKRIGRSRVGALAGPDDPPMPGRPAPA